MQTIEGEHLKSLSEYSLHTLARYDIGRYVLHLARGGERIEDPRLHTAVAGIEFENPVMVGAGWDKKGRCIDGLYILNFAGSETGTVLPYIQDGKSQPRLFIDKDTKSVGLNRLGFNSGGMRRVDDNLSTQKLLGVVGISVGKNDIMPVEHEPWAHAVVVERLGKYADYIALGISSPNTPGLRGQMDRDRLTDIIQAVQEVSGELPIFAKTTVDLDEHQINSVIEVCLENNMGGIIDTNTTIDETIKAKYGWAGQDGGVSGNDPDYRRRATERMRHITRETRGTGFQRIGVGAINNAETALERIQAGAQVVQLVTAIREHKGRVARNINLGLLNAMERDGVKSIKEYVGVAA